MSMPFTRRLSLLFGNELSKIVINLLTGNLDTFLDEANYAKLVDHVEDRNSKHSKAEILDNLLKHMGKGAEWQKAIRAYMVVHKLIHKQGEEMIIAFHPERVKKFSDVKLPKKIPLKKHEIQPLLPLYLDYLQELAKHHKNLSVCFSTYEHCEDILENSADLLVFLSTCQNILNILLKMFPMIQNILGTTKGTGLLKQASYYCLTDAHNIYTYLNTIIGVMINEIFNLPQEDATTLYAIYSEHIFMSKKLKDGFDLKNHLTDFYVPLPEFFQINIPFNSQVEIYISGIKRRQFGRKENCSLGMEQPKESSVSPRDHTNAKSLCEISQSVVRSISNLHVSDKTQPILPPKFFARRQNMNSLNGVPKIKVKKPANKFCDPASNIYLKKGSEANHYLLKVPTFDEDIHFNNATPPEEHPPEEHTEVCTPIDTGKYTLQVRCNSQNILQVPNEKVNQMITLMVPTATFLQQPTNMGSCRSLTNITPTRSLAGSFAAETISVENLS